jgi:chromosome segregation ATPase
LCLRTFCFLSFLPILIYCAFYLAAAADASELEAAKKKIAELEGQLGEKDAQLGQRDAQLGQKDAQLESAKTENARLTKVEIELQAQVQKLTSDHAAARTAHAAELQRLLDAREETEGQLMKERDLAVKRLEEINAQYEDQIRAAQAKYDLSLACLHRADIALAGMPCFPCSFAAPN